jgi:hypothetical protein
MIDVIDTIILPISGGLVLMLMGIIGWIGNKIDVKLEHITGTLSGLERDMRGELTMLDRRQTVTETKVNLIMQRNHNGDNRYQFEEN